MARSYAKAVDDVLAPLGFARSGDDWVRVRGDMWESVNRQPSNHYGVTLNLLMKDLETERLFLEIFASLGAVQMPPMTWRIGDLTHGGHDGWWRRGEPDGPGEMSRALVAHGLPWFERVRTLEAQAENWFGRRTMLESRGYPGWPMVYLALTLYRMGETEEACAVLRKPVPKTAHHYSVRVVAHLRAWMGCDAEGQGLGRRG